ncbi:MAG: DNA-binding protein [Betaproteobacteria bacterium]|nr:DNA-binding protein [Betaproteobacteria bacterium]
MTSKTFQPVPLDQETRSVLPTAEAAAHLNRADQTLRIWACKENGPIRPIRVNGRLAWPVAKLRRILGVA